MKTVNEHNLLFQEICLYAPIDVSLLALLIVTYDLYL